MTAAAESTIYGSKPWLARYAAGQQASITVEFDSALDMFKAAVARDPDGVIIRYFDGQISLRELDGLTDAFAAAIVDAGFTPGERVAVYLQNVPQFLIAQIGTWKAGGIAVSINPMNKQRELTELLTDSGATVLVAMESLYRDVASKVVPGTKVRTVITTSELEYQTRNDPRISRVSSGSPVRAPRTFAGCSRGSPARAPPAVTLSPDDIAFLTYTSGTTGPPKGAMTTHRNVVFNAQTYRDWVGLTGDNIVLGVAPLFHITGLVGHVAISLLIGAPLILMYRLDPTITIETIRDEKATFTVGSITVFIALMNAPGAEKESLATLTKIFSGGAPIPPSTVVAFKNTFGALHPQHLRPHRDHLAVARQRARYRGAGRRGLGSAVGRRPHLRPDRPDRRR